MMSAVDEYRKDKVYLAEACAAGTLEDLADAAVAELEAKLQKAGRRKANTEWNALVRQSDENLARAERAEAELAKFKSQLCDGCGFDRLQECRLHYLHKCRYCNAELPWTDGTDTEYWCQNCGKEQPATWTEVRWVAELPARAGEGA